MWYLLLLLALVIVVAQFLLWRLQRRLLTSLMESRRRVQALEEAVARLTTAWSALQKEHSIAAPAPAPEAVPSVLTPDDSEDRYRRALMLAQSGLDARRVAAICGLGEGEAELLLRMQRGGEHHGRE
ncbi:MAG: DUF2802 domain-containing protein [Acidithiobacillus sp.]